MQWPFLTSCSEEGLLEPIDILFAQRMLARTRCTREEVGAFLALMLASYRQGHLCFTVEKNGEEGNAQALYALAEQGQELLPEEIWQEIEGDLLTLFKPICRWESRFYFHKSWVFETQFLHHYLRLIRAEPRASISFPQALSPLSEDQHNAINRALHSPVSLIVGGPGTGKTFTAKHLVKQCLEGLSREEKKNFQILLAAPTGKAVTHLEKQIRSVVHDEEQHIVRAGTLHALLQMREEGTQRQRVVLQADLILVDECSMIDAKIGALLLTAIPSGARLVLIGDKDQLSAVEAGSFFADLIDAGCPSSLLQSSRRSEDKKLHELTAAICSGAREHIHDKLAPFLHGEKGPIQQVLSSWSQRFYPSFFSTLPRAEELLSQMEQFRILSCLRQGPLGVDKVNGSLFHFFQSHLPQEGWWTIPILITRNDYSSQLYNGDTGILVKRIERMGKKTKLGREDYALFMGREPIPALALPPFEYGYCLSVHKSQGSEYDRVLLLIPEGSERFGREILYTGITRVRKELLIYTQPEIVEQMVGKSSRKISGLRERLQRETPCRR